MLENSGTLTVNETCFVTKSDHNTMKELSLLGEVLIMFQGIAKSITPLPPSPPHPLPPPHHPGAGSSGPLREHGWSHSD